METCALCRSSKNNVVKYGQFLQTEGLKVHLYCLYLTPRLCQNGTDNEGLMGFLVNDIKKAARQVSPLKCFICNKRAANIGCCISTCPRSFHLTCGIDLGVKCEFIGQFQSYCPKHFKKTEYNIGSSEKCFICYELLQSNSIIDIIRAPCCRNGFFHKLCLQEFANSSGYFFKCPLCNDFEMFREKLKISGIFIPNTDAAWELEPNAFEELLQRPDKCCSKTCRNRKGRKCNKTSNPLEICVTCGSVAIHRYCREVNANNEYICSDCKIVLIAKDRNHDIVKLVREKKNADENGEDIYVNIWSDSDSGDHIKFIENIDNKELVKPSIKSHISSDDNNDSQKTDNNFSSINIENELDDYDNFDIASTIRRRCGSFNRILNSSPSSLSSSSSISKLDTARSSIARSKKRIKLKNHIYCSNSSDSDDESIRHIGFRKSLKRRVLSDSDSDITSPKAEEKRKTLDNVSSSDESIKCISKNSRKTYDKSHKLLENPYNICSLSLDDKEYSHRLSNLTTNDTLFKAQSTGPRLSLLHPEIKTEDLLNTFDEFPIKIDEVENVKYDMNKETSSLLPTSFIAHRTRRMSKLIDQWNSKKMNTTSNENVQQSLHPIQIEEGQLISSKSLINLEPETIKFKRKSLRIYLKGNSLNTSSISHGCLCEQSLRSCSKRKFKNTKGAESSNICKLTLRRHYKWYSNYDNIAETASCFTDSSPASQVFEHTFSSLQKLVNIDLHQQSTSDRLVFSTRNYQNIRPEPVFTQSVVNSEEKRFNIPETTQDEPCHKTCSWSHKNSTINEILKINEPRSSSTPGNKRCSTPRRPPSIPIGRPRSSARANQQHRQPGRPPKRRRKDSLPNHSLRNYSSPSSKDIETFVTKRQHYELRNLSKRTSEDIDNIKNDTSSIQLNHVHKEEIETLNCNKDYANEFVNSSRTRSCRSFQEQKCNINILSIKPLNDCYISVLNEKPRLLRTSLRSMCIQRISQFAKKHSPRYMQDKSNCKENCRYLNT